MYETEGELTMADYEEKRMAGDYEVFQAISVGTKEIVMGESPNAKQDERYMCAYCTTNEIFAQYSGVMVSDDYTEILELFQERVRDETQKLREELSQPEREGIDDRPVKDTGYIPVECDDDLNGKVVVIRPDVLKREYQRATRQYQLCTGGFGASPNSRGSACFCTNIYSGQNNRFERRDVLGIVPEDLMPKWVREKLEIENLHRTRKEREAR
jgi:hypothetical protein